MKNINIISVDESNLEQYGMFCVKNPKHPGYVAKRKWLDKRFKEGLRLKILESDGGKQAGFIEYIPGEHTWRVIEAEKYFVIHCIWVNSKNFSEKGFASELIQNCIEDARQSKMNGVAVVTSDGSWMAHKKVFLNNGFEIVDEVDPHFQLLAYKIKNGKTPSFPTDLSNRKSKLKGLQILYTDQCPYIGKAIKELPPVAEKYGIELTLVEFNNSSDARRKMISPYGMFNLIYNGELLADHAISATRFKNILERDLKLSAD